MAHTLGLHVYQDSGPPVGSSNYTTLVILHGYAWHGGTFVKLIPFAQKHNARIVLVNRRDYPGAAPYTEEELTALREANVAKDPSNAHVLFMPYLKDRARELHSFLVNFVVENDIPSIHGNTGGIILAGWSLGSIWMTALLAHVQTFPVVDVELGAYMRRIVLHDSPYEVLGYASPANPQGNPLLDSSLPPEEVMPRFATWVSGYFLHGEPYKSDGSTLERSNTQPSPPPTLDTLTEEERKSALFPPPGEQGGSDQILFVRGISSGVFDTLRKGALSLRASGAEASGDAWPNIEVRYVWCDQSVWEVIWGMMSMKGELEEAKKAGKDIRKVTYLRLEGSNHFVHWDEPERALEAFLVDKSVQ
ncbi:hypothetical protein C8Q74DRAFT_1305452 [Fomes fomentarius]|nr:hypothetical protein C8Q74DRAFT_1305452 [Fomes fomentarius]